MIVGRAENAIIAPLAAPVTVDDAFTTREDTPAILDVLANDSDPDADPLSVTSVNVTETLGVVTINLNNTLTYDPAGAFNFLDPGQSAIDTFSYTASDGQGGEITGNVSVTISGRAEPAINPIVAENMLPGNPQSEWGINGPDFRLEGFATDISIDQGETVQFKIDRDAAITDYRIDVYRLGYYDGLAPKSRYDRPLKPRRAAGALERLGDWPGRRRKLGRQRRLGRARRRGLGRLRRKIGE